MIIFENVKMTYDEINILRNEISNGQLLLLFEGIFRFILKWIPDIIIRKLHSPENSRWTFGDIVVAAK